MTIPSVGVFWFVPIAPDRSQLLCDRTPLEEAEPYGDMLTHDRGHAEFWDDLVRHGFDGSIGPLLQKAVSESEYDFWPRGRVVFDSSRSFFVIYADRQLHRPNFVHEIKRAFGLAGSDVRLVGDQHYSRSAPIGRRSIEPSGD